MNVQKDISSKVMAQVFKELLEKDACYYEEMKSVAHAYISKQECSIQEALYHIIPELWKEKKVNESFSWYDLCKLQCFRKTCKNEVI